MLRDGLLIEEEDKTTVCENWDVMTMVLRTDKCLWILVLIWWSFAGAVPTAAMDYPQHEDPYVNDYAGVIEAPDVQRLRTMLADFKQQSGIDATVLTLYSINDYDAGDQSIESFANRLFDTWCVGDRATNKGVLLLVAVRDRKVRIELGKSYGHLYDAQMREVIDKHIVPAFRENDYSRGILQGTQAITRALIKTILFRCITIRHGSLLLTIPIQEPLPAGRYAWAKMPRCRIQKSPAL
ncbi:MAG: TPM domain-containing protein [Bacteroidetes bacterium]|nr:TPM domain-containing protein [Bacteroidota bacterium]